MAANNGFLGVTFTAIWQLWRWHKAFDDLFNDLGGLRCGWGFRDVFDVIHIFIINQRG